MSQAQCELLMVSIHAPRTGRDAHGIGSGRRVFQSTRPVRGATSGRTARYVDLVRFQSTRPVRGATYRFSDASVMPTGVSIHAPRTGRDRVSSSSIRSIRMFQSTRPVRGATSTLDEQVASLAVSIHAPRTGRDAFRGITRQRCYRCFNPRAPYGARHDRVDNGVHRWRGCFNPRAPHGARRRVLRQCSADGMFQSTRPARGATRVRLCNAKLLRHVSIHAPRAGRDVDAVMVVPARLRCFNPRAPRGARPS